MNFNELLKKNREKAAKRLSKRIQDASRIAKSATTDRGRGIAYGLKAKVLEQAIIRFPTLFKPISFEYHRKLGIVILCRLADGKSAHLPITDFTISRSRIDLNHLPYRNTLKIWSKKNEHF